MSETGFETFDDKQKFNFVTEEKEYNMENLEVTHVFDDVIYVEVIDEVEDDIVKRNGLFVPQNGNTKQYYRFLKVVLVGPKCDPKLEPGQIVMTTTAALAGSRGIKNSKGKFLMIPEKHLLAIVTPKTEVI